MHCNFPGSSVHEILQARILEWVAISFSRGFSWPRDRTWVSCIAGRPFTIWATREAPKGKIGRWNEDAVSISSSHLSRIWQQLCNSSAYQLFLPTSDCVLVTLIMDLMTTRRDWGGSWWQQASSCKATSLSKIITVFKLENACLLRCRVACFLQQENLEKTWGFEILNSTWVHKISPFQVFFLFFFFFWLCWVLIAACRFFLLLSTGSRVYGLSSCRAGLSTCVAWA